MTNSRDTWTAPPLAMVSTYRDPCGTSWVATRRRFCRHDLVSGSPVAVRCLRREGLAFARARRADPQRRDPALHAPVAGMPSRDYRADGSRVRVLWTASFRRAEQCRVRQPRRPRSRARAASTSEVDRYEPAELGSWSSSDETRSSLGSKTARNALRFALRCNIQYTRLVLEARRVHALTLMHLADIFATRHLPPLHRTQQVPHPCSVRVSK